MTTTLEKAARAAYERYGFTGVWDGDAEHPLFRSAQHDTKELFRAVARAVLMAVRTPDKAIIDAAFCDALEPVYPSDFTRVIDAILADGGE